MVVPLKWVPKQNGYMKPYEGFHSHGGTPSSLDGLTSGNLLQFAIENGSLTVDLPIPNGDFP